MVAEKMEKSNIMLNESNTNTNHSNDSPNEMNNNRECMDVSDHNEEDTDDDHDDVRVSSYSSVVLPNCCGRCSCNNMLLSLIIVIVGVIASTIFLKTGIDSAILDKQNQFDKEASIIINELQNSFKQYEVAALFVQGQCRNRTTLSRNAFHELYKYMQSTGLETQAIQCTPNITNDDRYEYEAEAREYYKTYYPTFNYTGIRGFEGSEDDSSSILQHRSNASFYFPIHYVEPILGNEAAIDVDLFSSPKRFQPIQQALQSWKPTLSSRLHLIQETNPLSYSVILYHPGIPLLQDDATAADPFQQQELQRVVSNVVIRISSLLALTLSSQSVFLSEKQLEEEDSQLHSEDKEVYIFDTTNSEDGIFLGASRCCNHLNDDNDDDNTDSTDRLDFVIDEVDLSTMKQQFHSRKDVDMISYQEKKVSIASSTWTILVMPSTNSKYHTLDHIKFLIVGGVMIVFSCIGLALYVYTNNQLKIKKIKRIEQAAKAEHAIVESLYPSNVRDRILSIQQGQVEEGIELEKQYRRPRRFLKRYDSSASNLDELDYLAHNHEDSGSFRNSKSDNLSTHSSSKHSTRHIKAFWKNKTNKSTTRRYSNDSMVSSVSGCSGLGDLILQNHNNSKNRKNSNQLPQKPQYHHQHSNCNSLHSRHGSNQPIIADYFDESTIMFADLVNFTKWSSNNEPEQIFVLLEAIYCTFDDIAKKLNVFKVETIGDCYVAACGVPDVNQYHATIMALFANECLNKIPSILNDLSYFDGEDISASSVTGDTGIPSVANAAGRIADTIAADGNVNDSQVSIQKKEEDMKCGAVADCATAADVAVVATGRNLPAADSVCATPTPAVPTTPAVAAAAADNFVPRLSDLNIRIGLHSGPIVGGVLRGQKGRFQLFGDTMNTTSRIETTGRAGKIHISCTTANFLSLDSKRHWYKKREDPVVAKGKGQLKTFWLLPHVINKEIGSEYADVDEC